MLAHTDQGHSRQLTVSLEKPLADNWSWMLAYTFTEAKEVGTLTSSQNTSNWNNQLGLNPNDGSLQDSRYAIRDRINGMLTFQKAFFGDHKTTASLVYEGRSGRPFSYVFYNDANGDSRAFNDLLYVPTGRGDVVFRDVTVTSGGVSTFYSAAQQEAAFFEWLAQHPELARYGGTFAPANGFRSGWTNTFDLRVSQELPGFWKGHKSSVTLDVMNVGNLLNKKWGLIEDSRLQRQPRRGQLHAASAIRLPSAAASARPVRRASTSIASPARRNTRSRKSTATASTPACRAGRRR